VRRSLAARSRTERVGDAAAVGNWACADSVRFGGRGRESRVGEGEGASRESRVANRGEDPLVPRSSLPPRQQGSGFAAGRASGSAPASLQPAPPAARNAAARREEVVAGWGAGLTGAGFRSRVLALRRADWLVDRDEAGGSGGEWW
jgi:hypothetical protein